MRIIPFLLLVCITQISFGQLPASGLIGHYTFDKEPGRDTLTVWDNSGNQNTGRRVGDITFTADRFGVGCSAMQFNGKGYVTIPNSPSLMQPTNGFTAAVWLKISKGADFYKQWITILCKSDQMAESANSPQYRMQATAQTVSLNTEFTETFIPPLDYDTWYFYVITFDGASVKVFLNGNFEMEYPFQGPLVPNDMPLEIGRDLPGAEEYFFGAMDDLRIYDRPLDQAELRMLFTDQSGSNQADRCQQPQVENQTALAAAQANIPKTSVSSGTNPSASNPSAPPTAQAQNQPDPLDSVAVNSTQNSTIDGQTPVSLPQSVNGIPVEYQDTITVKGREVFIYPYDNEEEDGDIVSIQVNGKWMLDNYLLKTKVDQPAPSDYFKANLIPGGSNYLLSKAWNTGEKGLNTMTVQIMDSHSTQIVTINSEEGLSGAVKIVCEGQ